MENTLKIIETENIVIYKDYSYGPQIVQETRKFFMELKEEGTIKNNSFDDDKWLCYSGIKHFEIEFSFDKEAFAEHIGIEFGISYNTMQIMLKCYAVYCTGAYIFSSIAQDIVNIIKEFLCKYKEKKFELTATEINKIEDFLGFINTPDSLIDEILANIKKTEAQRYSVRKLSPLINYLVIENELDKMYNGPISDEDFLKFFPLYFWVKVTFILPLRATEMLVTPFDCLDLEDTVTLRVRRTLLKGRGNRVRYDVDKDYHIFSYNLDRIINRSIFDRIKQYQELTKQHTRRFLFDFGASSTNQMLSLSSFNNSIKIFMDERIMDNPQYEYAKHVCGIDKFEYVSAGDSRPIAMANLFFQGASADICRQLANHMKISTSESYFTNVSETLYLSSIIRMQNKINNYCPEDFVKNGLVLKDEYGCASAKRAVDKNNIEDCKGHYEDCYGCRFYSPSDKEIELHNKNRKREFDENVKRMQNVLSSTNKIKGRDIDLDKLFIDVQTAGAKYKESTDVYAEKEAEKWLEH